jgi:EthD domain
VFKLITLLKRRPTLSREAFIDYYESTHVKIANKYMNGRATRYFRRYLQPVTNPLTGESIEPDFDVLTEVWFADRAAFEAAMVVFASPEVAVEIAWDEEHLFDRAKNRLFTEVEEHESRLTPI